MAERQELRCVECGVLTEKVVAYTGVDGAPHFVSACDQHAAQVRDDLNRELMEDSAN